jgi:hypothetical protein
VIDEIRNRVIAAEGHTPNTSNFQDEFLLRNLSRALLGGRGKEEETNNIKWLRASGSSVSERVPKEIQGKCWAQTVCSELSLFVITAHSMVRILHVSKPA